MQEQEQEQPQQKEATAPAVARKESWHSPATVCQKKDADQGGKGGGLSRIYRRSRLATMRLSNNVRTFSGALSEDAQTSVARLRLAPLSDTEQGRWFTTVEGTAKVSMP